MNNNKTTLIHNFNEENSGVPLRRFMVIIGAVLLIGGAVGFGASRIGTAKKSTSLYPTVQDDKSAGIADKKTFKDTAEGILREGGIDGEGNFHLERPGGKSQNVYLTSTTVDLSEYIGKKIKIHGETFSAQKAGWLMDVGLVEVQ